jgi:hypothetical protein
MRSWLTRVSTITLAVALVALATGSVLGETVRFSGTTGVAGLTIRSQDAGGVVLHYEIGSFDMQPLDIAGQTYQKISLPGVFLPNDAGDPDLPGFGRFLAMPRGATATVEILAQKTQTMPGMEVSPAPVIPKETDDGPLVYEKNTAVFGRDAFYPVQPVLLSQPSQIRGVDVVTLGVTPFQYNPVTKSLVVYTELDLRITFQGGTGQFGEDRLRSRYWEPILAQHLLNYETLPPVDFNQRQMGRNGFEYIIITPDNPDFIAWADTLKAWRKLQGISTEVFTTTQTGTTSAAIEAFLNNAYGTWDPAPDAFLLLGDYPSSGFRDSGITSPIWNSYCVSDNMYADVNGDDLPDMVHARLTARNAAELQIMIGKMLNYERHPYTDAAYYDHPIIAGGWQTERWFILCTEIIYGYQANVLGKHPTREYAIYSGTPGSSWSSNQNTSMLVNYFGPNGLGYIPATPQHLTDWGGNATRINNDINAGGYMLLHRDHGAEDGWGEPAYYNTNLSGLHNTELPFVFSMNCLTGKYNWTSQCFTETFHRMSQGALGLIAASEISYSFVNDTYIFGLFDTMWPGFMPGYGPYPPASGFTTDLRTAFGMVSGKYFLQSSSWPYNPGDKTVTYHLFHHHGDAFMTLFSQVPQTISVTHGDVCLIGATTFQVRAQAGSVIALTVNGQIVGVVDATGSNQDVPITPQSQPGTLRLTVTLANHYRYIQDIPILPPSGPYLVYHQSTVGDAGGDNDGQLDAGEAVNLGLTLRNVGVEAATGLSATLASADPYVQILTPVRAFPDIPAGGTGTATQPYAIQVAGTVPDAHSIQFNINAQGTQGSWASSFSVTAQAPILAKGDVVLDDSSPLGDGDGVAEPGESFYLLVHLINSGHSSTGGLTGTLSTEHPYAVVTDAQGEAQTVPPEGDRVMGAFVVQISPLCPDPSSVHFDLAVSGPNGFGANLTFAVDVGAWFDDGETDRGWTLGVSGDNATSGRWERVDPIGTTYGTPAQQVQTETDHSPDPGSLCFVTQNGVAGGLAGDSDVDGGKTTLLSPVFRLQDATSASLSYWRWYTNNIGNNPSQDYWDVDVTADGTNWVHLEHTTDSANSWGQFTFDLAEYVTLTNSVQVRFVADDESPGSLVEAAVDDIRLAATFVPAAGASESGNAVGPIGIVSCTPNPFHPRTSVVYRLAGKSTVSLALYDVAGRRVRTLVNGAMDAGTHTVELTSDEGGRHLPSGIYFLRMETPTLTQVKQVTLLK